MIETEKADDPEVVSRTSVSLEVPPAISPLKLQPDAEQTDAGHYFRDELLKYHDRVFIEHVYSALARRQPTQAELTNTLDDLRSGRTSKMEIIESLLGAQAGGQPTVHVDGLPSPMLRRFSRWPVIGYLLRILRGFTRIPLLIENQQQFEAYALGQQQRIEEYVNDVIVSALLRITRAMDEQQQRLDELQRSHAKEAAGQREFLVQEQRAIVEAQKVALSELQEQLRALARAHADKRAELTAEVRDLPAPIEDQRDDATAAAGKQKRKQV
jgi:hypothetical protein